MTQIKAVVIVGGPAQDSDFSPLSLSQPKPLFPIGGRPLLIHHLSALSKIGSSLSEVLLIGYYEASLFTTFIDDARRELDLDIKYLREFQPLGTAGGLYHFRTQILRGSPSAIIVLHADVYCTFPLSQLLEAHRFHEGIGVIVAVRVAKNSAMDYGCIVAESETNRVVHFVDKPQSFISDLISCGVYVFDRRMFADHLEQCMHQREQRAIANGNIQIDIDAMSLEHDVLPLLGSSLFVYEMDGFWTQVKNAASTILANRLCLEYLQHVSPSFLSLPLSSVYPEIIGPVYIDPLAAVHYTAKLGPNVSIGAGCVIGAGVRIRESIILAKVRIKEHACVINSIIGWSSQIGAWSRIEGTLASEEIPLGVDRKQPNGSDRLARKKTTVTILGSASYIADECLIRNCIVLPNKDLHADYHDEIVM